MDDFVIRALAAGIGIALVAGPLGCFMVWRRMAYFSDSLAHSALLGIALGLALGIQFNLAVALVCAVFAILLVWMQQRNILPMDSVFAILAHASLSIGIIVIGLLEKTPDLHSYLFGDILIVDLMDVLWVLGGSFIVLVLLWINWSPLVLMTIQEDLAKAEGVNTFRKNLLLVFLMTIVVAISIQIVGVLLITALLIIPAATARQFANSPQSMALFAAGLGSAGVALGIFASLHYDIIAGPGIVTSLAAIFVVSLCVITLYRKALSR